MRLLLEKGAELESKDSEGQTPLSWAAAKGMRQLYSYYLKKALSPPSLGAALSVLAGSVAARPLAVVIRFRAGINFLDASLTLVIQ